MQLLQLDNGIEIGFVAQKVNTFLKNGPDTEKNDRHFQFLCYHKTLPL